MNMTVNKRKKITRQRGQWTHGYGSKKKHRGAGSRGGKGMAGSGKRGDAKKPSVWNIKNYMGKHGFTSKSRRIEDKTVNIGYLEENLSSLEKQGVAEKKGDAYNIDISKLNCTKLLGSGKITKKYEITALVASAKAVEKIKALGGKVNTLQPASSSPEAEQPEEPKKDASDTAEA